jgi:hypothetical protein
MIWDWWWWLTKPQLCLPPEPDDRNLRGLGWAGDRREIRPWLSRAMEEQTRRPK